MYDWAAALSGTAAEMTNANGQETGLIHDTRVAAVPLTSPAETMGKCEDGSAVDGDNSKPEG